MTDPAILDRLAATIEARKSADPTASYVAKLLHEGEDKILRKVAEEAVEIRHLALSRILDLDWMKLASGFRLQASLLVTLASIGTPKKWNIRGNVA